MHPFGMVKESAELLPMVVVAEEVAAVGQGRNWLIENCSTVVVAACLDLKTFLSVN